MADVFFDDEAPASPPPAGDYVPAPRRGVPRWVRGVGLVAVLGLVVLGVAGVWVQRRIDPPGSPGDAVALTIPNGTSTAAIADLLAEEGIVSDATVFRYYVRFKGAGPFLAGAYTLRRNSSMADVLAVLRAGPEQAYTRITVPEGLTLPEIAERVGANERFSGEVFLERARSGEVRSVFQPDGVDEMEGLLFPETYTVDEREDEDALLRRMVATFDETATELGYADAESRVGLTPYETIVVASLVEAEARVPEDRAKISRVIHNRLAKGMLLQIDATVIYARGERREDGRVLYRDLEVDSPYNTYKHAGLPPTPIEAPGRAALEAAINPAEGDWLFYVKYETDGTHAFSETLAEHNRRIREAKERGVNP